MGSSASDPAMLKIWRDHRPPSSASLFKLSQLSCFNKKYESPLFSSGGHSWRLVVYPKGNEEDNGKGFVSMYVELDKSSSTPPTEVFAYLSFFISNKLESEYFSVQDVEVKRFDSSRTVWGVPQMLSLEKFNDPANYFILDGEECKFGAHVMVPSSPPVSFGETLPFHKFSWKVRHFSVLKQNDSVSKTFPMGEKNWTLKLCPKGDSESDGELTMTLYLADGEILLRGELIFVRINLKVLDPRGSKHLTGWLQGWIMNSDKERGLPQSMSLAELQQALDRDGTLDVEIECEVLNVIKNSPFF